MVRFEDFKLDMRTGELRRGGTRIRLQEQPFQILALLLERAGEVVTREELQHKLWAADTFVDFDNGLNIAIKKLRTALGDDAEAPRYIETLPRRGYRFLAQVTVDTAEPARPSAQRRPPLVLVPKQEEPAVSATLPESTTLTEVHPASSELGTSSRSTAQVAARERVLATLPSSDRSWKWIAIAAVTGAITAALLLWWSRPPSVPVAEAVEQLTDDGDPKQGVLVSDGSRVYFNEGPTASWKIAQVSVNGGRTALVDTRLVNPQIAGLVPDGSALLALVGGNTDTSYPLWSIPLPAGEPQRLGNLEMWGAGVLPDGRIAFGKGTDLFVADKDGSNPHKLVSVAGYHLGSKRFARWRANCFQDGCWSNYLVTRSRDRRHRSPHHPESQSRREFGLGCVECGWRIFRVSSRAWARLRSLGATDANWHPPSLKRTNPTHQRAAGLCRCNPQPRRQADIYHRNQAPGRTGSLR